MVEESPNKMNPTILVVDDESVTRRLLTFALKAINVDVIAAQDATEALDLVHKHDFHLILVDLNLPDMDGIALMRRFRMIPRLDQTPLVCFTARNNPDDEAYAREAGAIDFMYKPFSTQELRDLVKKYL
jgi:CheY-like chemotaxis protein